MSSPIARQDDKTRWLHRVLNRIHQEYSHANRVDILAHHLTRYIKDVMEPGTQARCLDVGCGDLSIQGKIKEALPGTTWKSLDLYDLPAEFAGDPIWQAYQKFNGRDLPLPDNSAEIILFCDMLHHANENIPYLMREAHRVANTVIIKDVLEYSLYSRCVLQAMDVVGNWGYGVPLPKRYFTLESFKSLCEKSGFALRRMDIGLQLYGHLPVLRTMLRPNWHFFAILDRVQEPARSS
jgi:hypothetical protein